MNISRSARSERSPPGWRRLDEAAWLGSRAVARASASQRPARPRRRPAGAGHPRLHRRRSHHPGAAPRPRRRRLPRPPAGSCGWNMGARADTIERLRQRLEPDLPRPARAGRRLEPRRRLRPRARPRPPRPGPRRRHPGLARSARTPSSTMSGGSMNGSPATRSTSRRSRASPPSRRSRRLAIWSRKDGIIAPAAARGEPDETDKQVELDCTPHGVRRLPPDGQACSAGNQHLPEIATLNPAEFLFR